jgi:DnaD/phage-associated family protein
MTERFVVKNAKKQPFVMMERVLVFDEKYLDTYDKMVYLALCGFADNQTGQSYPSRALLARICRCSKDRVDKSLKNLERLKLLHIQKRKKEGSKENDTNVYTLLEIPEFFYEGSRSERPPWSAETATLADENGHPSRSERQGTILTELDSNNYKNTTTAEGQNSTNPFVMYQECFGRFPTPMVIEEIRSWLEDDHLEEKLVSLAIYKAARNGQQFGYARGIINSWMVKGIKTYQQALCEEKERKERKEQNGGRKTVPQHSGSDGRFKKEGRAKHYQPGKWGDKPEPIPLDD